MCASATAIISANTEHCGANGTGMSAFQTVGIIAKQEADARVPATLRRLLDHLRQRGRQTRLDPATARLLEPDAEQTVADQDVAARNTFATLATGCDLIIVLGGDGTFLHVARDIAPTGTPLVGINLGRLGFLVDLSPEEIETRLDAILEGDFTDEYRSLLETRLIPRMSEAEPPEPGLALNEAVIAKWDTVRMIEFETYIDGGFVNVQRCDGLIIATPTGSTAYALSGGGPLLHPRLDTMLLVPICPHTLSQRPLVIAGASEIEIRLCHQHPETARLTCDGQVAFSLQGIDAVRIQRSLVRVRLLHPRDHDHFRLLRAKLGWGGQAQESSNC